MKNRYAKRMERVKPSAIRELLKLGGEPGIISFGGGYPDPEIFPIEQLAEIFSSVVREQGRQALQYAASDGLPSLREKLAGRMKRVGVQCTLDNLFMTQGGQQGLDLMARMLIDPGDVIVTERPTFLGALIAFNPCEPSYACVGMDENGMKMDELEKVLEANPKTKFIYTVPEFQNPTGVTMSLERRKKLVELADRYDVMVLEDSPYREIRYQGEHLPAIKSFDTQGRVVYLGSFSKILCPGMRLGWIVADAEVAEKMCLLKMAEDTQNSTINMYAADRFMEKYDMDAHIEKIRKIYKRKKDLMLDTIRKTFPGEVSFTDPEGGLFTWLTFPEKVDAAKLMKERTLPEAKVAYVPGATFFPVDEEANHCRVNYSCMSEEKIVEGITRLGEILKSVI